ncbi:MAG: site-2 protease family protein [Chloroflexi bacterium]|nr:site-2 protease family protein [Chloroflexota bacterium]
MFKGSVPIGSLFGIAVRLHYSWFIVFLLVTWLLAYNYFPLTYPNWPQSTSILAGVITSFLFFSSVLTHEIMHSLVARREGIPVRSITLFIFGGVSEMTQEPARAKDEFWMALAGPGTSLVLGAVFWGVFFLSRDTNQFVAAIAYWLGLINVALGVFNFIPGFPLDGGRVFRSILWWRIRDLRRATKIASWFGRGVAFLFIAGGILIIFTGNWFNGLWIAFIGWFLDNAATNSYRQVALQEMLKGHIAREIMTTECTLVSPDMTIERLVNEYVFTTGRRCFPVTDESRVRGLVTMADIRAVPRDRWSSVKAREAMTNLDQLKTVSPTEELANVLQIMAQSDINQVPVVEDHKIVGMIGRDNLIAFINMNAELKP